MTFHCYIYQLFKATYRNNVDLTGLDTIIKECIYATVTEKAPQFIIADIDVGRDYFMIIVPVELSNSLKRAIGSALAKTPELGQYTINYYNEDGTKKKSGHLFKCGAKITAVITEVI